MPIYCQNPKYDAPFTYENMIYLERIPTASCLLRVYKAPRGPDGQVYSVYSFPFEEWQERGVMIRAPQYKEGVYSTPYYRVTPLENQIFKIRRARYDPPITDVVRSMQRMNNLKLETVHLSHFQFLG